MQLVQVKDRMYGFDFKLIFNCGGDEIAKWLFDKFGFKEDFDSCEGYFFYFYHKGNPIRLIWLESFSSAVYEQSILAHEILHLAITNLKHIGIKLSDESEEAYTYYFQHLMQQSWIALWKYNDKRRKKCTNGKKKKS